MSKMNKDRTGCRDVFHAYFVEDAEFDGNLEIPYINREMEVPNKLISFSDALRTEDFDQWVHFYEDDGNFERLGDLSSQIKEIQRHYFAGLQPL